MPIDGNLGINMTMNDRRVVGLSPAVISLSRQIMSQFSDGSGPSQVNRVYHSSHTLGGSPTTLDLAGVLTDAYGSTVNLARVKMLYIRNTGNANITVGGGTNPWNTLLSGGTLVLRPDTVLFVYTTDSTGWTVTAGTGDILQVSGTSGQTFEVAFAGSTT